VTQDYRRLRILGHGYFFATNLLMGCHTTSSSGLATQSGPTQCRALGMRRNTLRYCALHAGGHDV